MLTIKEEQKIELDIMKDLHKFCVNNNLRYLLAYGTLLGAVRHKGFIPWDNDIDIIMPRNDFERFIELTKNEEVSNNLFVEHYSIDNKYHYQCIRVCDKRTNAFIPYINEQPTKLGLWVDIFPADGNTNNFFIKNIQKIQLLYYRYIFKSIIYKSNKNYAKLIKRIIRCFYPMNNRVVIKIEKICKKTPFDKYKYCSCLFEDRYLFTKRNVNIDIAEFDNPMLMEFEGEHFFGPKKYDDYLTGLYNNYMELPPVEKRIIHTIDVEYLENK